MKNQPSLPIALILPHGGLTIPSELDGRVALTPAQIFNEADAYVDDIFDFRDRVLAYETFAYGRALLDMNRPADAQLHHRHGDGVVKRITSYGAPVYHPHLEPDPELEQTLIHRYWQHWHGRLTEIEQDERIKLVIDCHSMAAIGPTTYDDPARLRPCLQTANLGDNRGELTPLRGRLSAPADITCFLAEKLGSLLVDVPPLAEVGADTAVNEPFWGGWDLWAHGHDRQPWLMIELNRALYIGTQDGDSPIVLPDPDRIALLREKIWEGITAVTDFWLNR